MTTDPTAPPVPSPTAPTQVDETQPPEYCPLFHDLRCDQLQCIELYGMANDATGNETGVLLGRMSPEATAEDVAKDFGGGRFELKAIGRSRGGDTPYTKMRGLHLAGEERWRANVAGLEDPNPASRTGALPGAGAHPPYGYGGVPSPYGMPGVPTPGATPGSPYGGTQTPGAGGYAGFGAFGTPGFRAPYPGMPGGYPGAPGFGVPGAGAGVVAIPKDGAIAPGLPPQQAQQVIDKELEERRRREDVRDMVAAQTAAQSQTLNVVTQMASVFKGDAGSTDQRLMFYQSELNRKNSEMDQQRIQFQTMLAAKDQQIFTLQQQLLTGQQGSQSQYLQLQQENMQLKGEIQALNMRLQMGNPGGGPSGAVQVAQAVGPVLVEKVFGIPGVADAVGKIAQSMAKGAGGLPGGGTSPPLPSGQ